MLYLLFFGSGASSLIYEVVWVRVFANVFGNTIYSASIVTAVFMLGLGIGGYVAGAWADRRYKSRPGIDASRVWIVRAGDRRARPRHLGAAAAPREPLRARVVLRARRGRLVRALLRVVRSPWCDSARPSHTDHAADARHADAPHSSSRPERR